MSHRRSLFALASSSMLALAACGGGTTLTVDITDAPPDIASLAHVYVSLDAVEVHVVDKTDKDEGDPGNQSIDKDDKWQEVTARAGTIDLMALRDGATQTLGELGLEEGKITQIRLFVDGSGRNEVELEDGQVCPLDLTAVDQGGVKINHPFKAIDLPDGERVRVVVDFDLTESVDQAGACAFALHPVLKLKTTTVE